MRLLLDTHVFLWFIGGDAALSPLIVAQGQAEDIPIPSRDPAFDDYAIRRL